MISIWVNICDPSSDPFVAGSTGLVAQALLCLGIPGAGNTFGRHGVVIWMCSDPWRIHGAARYGVPWIPSIYPSHVSIYASTMDPSWVSTRPGNFLHFANLNMAHRNGWFTLLKTVIFYSRLFVHQRVYQISFFYLLGCVIVQPWLAYE